MMKLGSDAPQSCSTAQSRRRWRIAVALSLLIWPASLSARTIYVTTTAAGSASDGQCGLYEAVQAVNQQAASFDCPAGDGNDDVIILLNPGTYHQSSPLDINRDVRIEGTGKEGTIVSFEGLGPGFTASSSAPPYVNAWLAEMTVQGNGIANRCVRAHGSGGGGGWVTLTGVRVTGCTVAGVQVLFNDNGVTIEHSEIVGNTGHGIYLYQGGILMVNSLVAYNDAQGGNGGGLYQVQGNSNNNVYNTIFAHNTAARGGGVYVDNSGGVGYLDIFRSTIAYNSASIEGGGAYQASSGGTPMRLYDAIAAANTAPNGPRHLRAAPDRHHVSRQPAREHLVSPSHQDCVCVAPPATLPPRIGPLGDYGGNWGIDSIPLLAGSYAFDRVPYAAGGSYNTFDQRGLPRPKMVIPWQASQPQDLGAVEMDPYEIQGLFQGEILSVAASSGDAHTISTYSSASGGKYAFFQANATNDYVTYSISVPVAGSYEIRSAHRMYNNRGIYRLFHSASVAGPFSAIGDPIDFYSPASELGERIHGTVALPAGTRYFRFTCTGKNASSTGYRMALDYLTLIKL